MNNTPDTNQANEDEPINQHLVSLWQLQDIEVTIADASPEELVDLHSKLVALSTDITEGVLSLVRNEKLKLLAEVRERVVGEDILAYDAPGITPHLLDLMECQNQLRADQRVKLTKLEADL